MPILSEGKGVDMWLSHQGIHPQNFRQFVVSKSPESLDSVSYKVKRTSKEKFGRFMVWFKNQDVKELRKEYSEVSKKKAAEKTRKKNERLWADLSKMQKIGFDSLVDEYRGQSKNAFVSKVKTFGCSYAQIKRFIKIWKDENL